ncbi:MAG: PilZ domain-containing protein [Candidatus Eremiobacteraeota bacterium]|nr:PilZ domain-containing protein [Candidatus Eremiobacteraeota bacterium]
MFKSIFGRAPEHVPVERLPRPHSIVDVLVAGHPLRQVVVETITEKEIVTKESLGNPGDSAVIVYDADAGRFRVRTTIASVTSTTTRFAMPSKIGVIEPVPNSQKRSSMRMDTLVTGGWRLAPSGHGIGPFVRSTIRDISRGGCSLICERELKSGTEVEVELRLSSGAAAIVVLGSVMRHEHIAQSGKYSHGLRFAGILPAHDRAIVEFINRKQTDLRNRGLA